MRPSALAALRFTAISNLTGTWTGDVIVEVRDTGPELGPEQLEEA
jgi:signal transduction histidine kinase